MKLSELAVQLATSDPPISSEQQATPIASFETSLADHPQHDPELQGVAALDQSTPGMLSFIEGAKWADKIDQTQASALILPRDLGLQAQATAREIAWLSTDQPRYLFARAIACFYQPWQLPSIRHPSAVLDPTVVMGEEVAIGAHVVIHSNVTIGNSVQIHANVVIYPGVRICDRTILHANCVIHEGTMIGANCIIHSGAVIGAAGFG